MDGLSTNCLCNSTSHTWARCLIISSIAFRFVWKGCGKNWAPSAPTFMPTDEEFQEPLKFIRKISEHGMRTGIVKIIPPARESAYASLSKPSLSKLWLSLSELKYYHVSFWCTICPILLDWTFPVIKMHFASILSENRHSSAYDSSKMRTGRSI